MRPLSWAGIALVAAGIIILAMRGVSFTKNRNDVEVGPIKVSSVEKGFVPPIVGAVALLLGAGILVADRRRHAA